MVRRCCVPSCNSGRKCNICQVGYSFFKTPRDPVMLKKWELALGLKNQSLQLQDRVCSLHFRKYDIVTKRFVSLKRPTTNSKMILEISKLERYAVPTVLFTHEMKQCTHGRDKYKSSIRCNAKSCRSTESATSAQASSQSDDTDDSSADDYQQQQQQQQQQHHHHHHRHHSQSPLPSRRDYRETAESVANHSNRRQIRALTNLRAKWLEKKKNLTKDIRLLEARIAEFTRTAEQTYESH